jgi:PAS domain S-box-containing protein
MNSSPVHDLARALFHEAGDGLFLFDPDTEQILEVNRMAEALTGYSAAELGEMQASNLLRSEAAERLEHLQHAYQHTGIFHSQEGYLLRCRSPEKWVPVNVTITRLHVQPKPLGLITVRDLREQRQAHLRLKKVEGELRRVLASVSDCLYSGRIDSSGRVSFRYFSPVIREVTGYPARFFLDGMASWRSIIHPDDRTAWDAVWRERSLGRSGGQEFRILCPDGTRRWVADTVRVEFDTSRGLHLLNGVLSNVSDRKRAEEELKQAKEAAEAASRAKGDFLARMSHELRTPLNAVIGMTGLTLDTPVSPEQRHYLELVQSSAEGLLRVVNDILDFSKIEAGKLALNEVPFELCAELERSLAAFHWRVEQKGLELTYRVADAVPARLRGDPDRLRQVLVNLLGNAVKFTERGQVCVQVALAPERPAPGQAVLLHFQVSDTGVGIPLGQQRRIFEPFAQADGSTSRKYGGTGLGLSISAQLVDLLGGRLWVESTPGTGSTFQFTARFGLAAETVEAPPAPELPPAVRPLRVLLAEDNPVNQELGRKLLEKQGHDVIVVSNGHEALAALGVATNAPGRFDVVLMDVQMPEMNGLEATARIRAWDQRTGRHTPIIALTAHALPGDRERCLAAGMNGYVSKPLRPEELCRALAEVTSVEGPALDLAAAAARLGGNVPLVSQLVGVFCDHLPKALAELREALAAGDASRLETSAHALHGAARTLCAAEVARAAAQLERLSAEARLAEAPAALAELERALARLGPEFVPGRR